MKPVCLETERMRARKSASAIAMICGVASLIAFGGWYLRASTQWHWLVTAIVCSIAYVALRRNTNVRTAFSALLISIVSFGILISTTVTNFQLAGTVYPFEAFGGLKLLALTIGLIAAHPLWLGALLIGLCGLTPILLYYFALPADRVSTLSVQEPFITLIYAFLAAVLYYHRLKTIRLERELIRVQSEKKALDDLTQIFLSLRDLANTPLQALKITQHLLKSGILQPEHAAEKIELIMKNFEQLTTALNTFAARAKCDPKDSSFDSIAILNEKLKDLEADR